MCQDKKYGLWRIILEKCLLGVGQLTKLNCVVDHQIEWALLINSYKYLFKIFKIFQRGKLWTFLLKKLCQVTVKTWLCGFQHTFLLKISK